MKKGLLFLMMLVFVLQALAQTQPKGLAVNTAAPDFAAIDQRGETIQLKELLKKGPVVLVFYRGQWCPYCNRQLKKIQDSLSLIENMGASVVAVSPEQPAYVQKTIEKTRASYPVLSDTNLAIMKSYEVVFDVDTNTVKRYKGYGIDFDVVNGQTNGARLPVPALYIINKRGIITYRHFDPDYKSRADLSDILTHL